MSVSLAAAGALRLSLVTESDNSGALAFYARTGFERVICLGLDVPGAARPTGRTARGPGPLVSVSTQIATERVQNP